MNFWVGNYTPGVASILFDLGTWITECPSHTESARVNPPRPRYFNSSVINDSLGIALIDSSTSVVDARLLNFIIRFMVSCDGAAKRALLLRYDSSTVSDVGAVDYLLADEKNHCTRS